MKSSRQRFQEFREKIRKGLLEPERYRDPNDKREIPSGGRGGWGRHHHGGDGPGGKYEFKRKKKQLLSEYHIMLKGYYGPLLVLMSLIVIGTILALITPLTLKYLIDYICKNKSLAQAALDAHATSLAVYLPTTPRASLTWLAGVLIATALISVVLDWVRLLAQQRLNFRLAGSLRQRLHEHLAKLPLAQLADYKTGGIVSRIMGDTEQVVGGIQNAVLTPFDAFLKIAGCLFLLIYTDWRLAAGAALAIPPVLVLHFLLFKRLRPMWRNIQDDRSLLSARLTDMFGGIRVVRSFRRERYEHKEFGAHQDTMIRKQQYTNILGRFLGTGWGVFVPAISVVIVWYGGLRVIEGALGAGDLVMFQAYTIMLLGPITRMIESLQNLQQNLGALDRVVDVLSQPPDMPDLPDAKPVSTATTRGELALRNVTFGYSSDRVILNAVSLHIPAGTTLAIVGPSGSGKTTLVNLVARFFDVKANGDGSGIYLDDIDIRNIQRDSYRALFAMVLQDVYLFDGTIAQNIAYGRRHATQDQIIDAATRANAHEFILEQEKGYETLIGERGSKLSGGQKQRISIARAILADPKILILDEATSSLDTASEHLIQNSLRQLMANRTTLVIAHRLSTIMHADRIVVLVDGQIVEQGSHDQLLESRGVYHTMFTQQFERHRDPALERIEWEKTKDDEKAA